MRGLVGAGAGAPRGSAEDHVEAIALNLQYTGEKGRPLILCFELQSRRDAPRCRALKPAAASGFGVARRVVWAGGPGSRRSRAPACSVGGRQAPDAVATCPRNSRAYTSRLRQEAIRFVQAGVAGGSRGKPFRSAVVRRPVSYRPRDDGRRASPGSPVRCAGIRRPRGSALHANAAVLQIHP